MRFPTGPAALTESMFGQMLIVPFTEIEPVVGAWWQLRCTLTDAVAPAVTLKLAEPPQLVLPSVEVAEIVMR